ncbi:MAG TPA: YCF48-related protein [bacterium]|jgi:photosystem II stability/assembly factor-like uncharacterized protein
MKYFHLVLLLGLLAITPSLSAQVWEWQRPALTGNTLNSVTFNGTGSGWAAGSGGTLLHTTDSGLTWNDYSGILPRWANVQQIVFADSLHGWAIGIRGIAFFDFSSAVFRTTDGGESWEEQTSISADGFPSAIAFPTPAIGFMVGYASIEVPTGVLWRTTDSGDTWASTPLDSMVRARHLKFVDSQNGWIVGGPNVLRTTDGGQTWMCSHIIPDTPFYNVSGFEFASPLLGWATVPLFGLAMYRTTDGGVTWSQLHDDYSYGKTLLFTDEWHGWSFGNRFTSRTTDGGITWIASPDTLLNVGSLNGGWTDGNGRVFAVAEGGTILASVDSGTHWSRACGGLVLCDGIPEMCFSDARHGWIAAGPNLLYTTNGGQEWNTQTVNDTVHGMGGITFTDSLHGWIVVGDGAILKTVDGGATWAQMRAGQPLSYGDRLSVTDSLYGWFGLTLGDTTTVLRTTNGGQTWMPQRRWTHASLSRLQFVDRRHGWVMTDSLFRTRNGGISWDSVVFGQYRFPAGFFALDSAYCWVTVADQQLGYGYVIRTTNGGDTWERTEDPLYPYFCSRSEGWSLGNIYARDGVEHTTDEGTFWEHVDFPGGDFRYNFVAAGPENIWAVGTGGCVLHYDAPAFSEGSHAAPPSSIHLCNYPNPFNPTTEIRFDLARAGKTSLKVYDLLGKEVAQLMNDVLPAGVHNATFDASKLPSGIYFYRLQSGTEIQSRKMIVLK